MGVFASLPEGSRAFTRRKELNLGLMDKIMGRTKQAAGDITGDASLRREGRQEERKGKEKDELARAQEKAEEKAQDVADLERKTS